MTDTPAAPIAAKRPTTRTFHGREFVDNYEWLRDKESPETIAHLEAENAYTAARTAHLDQLTEEIYHEVKGRVKETDMSVPSRRDGYWYYGRTVEGKNYGISCRVPAAADDWVPPVINENEPLPGEEVLIDGNALAEGHDFFSLGAVSVSPSGNLLAYSVDFAGDERFELHFKDLRTGELFSDHLTGVFYGGVWAGEDYFFYTTVDDAWRPDTIWRHRLGTPQSEDVVVMREEDAAFSLGIGVSRSRRYLAIGIGSKTTSEGWLLDYDNPTGEFTRLWPREAGVEYDVDHAIIDGADHWIVTHNATGPNFAVAHLPAPTLADAALSLPPLRELPELIAHRDDVRIEGVDTHAGHIAVGYRRGGIGRAAVMHLADGTWGEWKELEFAEELYTVGAGGGEWDCPLLRVRYTSFTQPSQLFDYRVDTGEFTLLKEQEVQGGYDASAYVARREWAVAADGTRVPISLVHRADLDLSQPQPTLLYGYGSYETSIDPYFSLFRLSLMDRGLIYAVVHVRGGGEMGRAWYDNGKMLHKVNTFTDFIAAADHLIATGVTAPDRLVAEGGSAGGLLMGAVANMAPDRFVGIQANVPFVDPLTSILMPELPLTVIEWEEWGDPYHDPEVYDYMATYAPYENVTAQEYPDILALTSLNDTRVLYVEPAKWVAKLREVATGGEFLLKTEMAAGHGGVSGRYDSWRQSAFEYAWTIDKATAAARGAGEDMR